MKNRKDFLITLYQKKKECEVLCFLEAATLSKNYIRLFTLLNQKKHKCLAPSTMHQVTNRGRHNKLRECSWHQVYSSDTIFKTK